MLLLADENFPRRTVDALREDEHHLICVRISAPGTKDLALLEMAGAEGRLILTLDKDFWQIAWQRREPISRCGVVLFRLHPAMAETLTPLARRILRSADNGWRGQIRIVTPDHIQVIKVRDRA